MQNNVNVHCRRKINDQWICAEHAIENDLELKLQGFEISWVDQQIVLEHYLKNRPRKGNWILLNHDFTLQHQKLTWIIFVFVMFMNESFVGCLKFAICYLFMLVLLPCYYHHVKLLPWKVWFVSSITSFCIPSYSCDEYNSKCKGANNNDLSWMNVWQIALLKWKRIMTICLLFLWIFFVLMLIIFQLIFDCAILDLHVALLNFKLHEIYAIHRFHYNLYVFCLFHWLLVKMYLITCV